VQSLRLPNTRTLAHPPAHPQPHTHSHRGTRRGAIGFPAEMRALSVGGKGGVAGGVWESRELCWWPPAFSDVAASNVSVRVCVSRRLTSLSFLLIFILTKKAKKKRRTLASRRRRFTWARTKGRKANRCHPRCKKGFLRGVFQLVSHFLSKR